MDRKIGIILGIITLLVFIGGILLVSKSPESTSSSESYDAQSVQGEIRHKKGPDDAMVTIVEFADFQCPACAAAHPYVNALVEKYPNDVRLVYRHFPLSQHKNAMIAAEASEAAGEQDKFWEMYDILFAKQSEWSEANNAQELFIGYAEDLGLDTEKFTKTLEDHTFKDIVNNDSADGFRVNVDATPTFFINNQKVTVGFDKLEEQVVSYLN